MCKKIISLIVLLAFLFSLSACAANNTNLGDGYKVTNVSVASLRINSLAGAFRLIMEEKGFFENHLPSDVQIEWQSIISGADQRDAIIAEKVDIGQMALSTFITSYEKDIPIQPISNNGNPELALWAYSNEITSINDIDKDDKIIVGGSLVSTTNLSFLAMCKSFFGDSQYFGTNAINIDATNAIPTLINTKDYKAVVIDAISVSSEYGLHKIMDLSSYIEEFSMATIAVASFQFAQDNPVIINAYYQAEEDTRNFIKDNLQEAIDLIKPHWVGFSDEFISDNLLSLIEVGNTISESGYDKNAQLLFEIGILDKEPKPFKDLPNYDEVPKTE